jgi:hypothetical protein
MVAAFRRKILAKGLASTCRDRGGLVEVGGIFWRQMLLLSLLLECGCL